MLKRGKMQYSPTLKIHIIIIPHILIFCKVFFKYLLYILLYYIFIFVDIIKTGEYNRFKGRKGSILRREQALPYYKKHKLNRKPSPVEKVARRRSDG